MRSRVGPVALVEAADNIDEFPVILQPDQWIGGAREMADHSLAVDNDHSRALDYEKDLLQPKSLVDASIRIGQHREWGTQDFRIAPRPLLTIAQDHQHVCTGRLEFWIKLDQLSNVVAALLSTVLAHEEEHHV